MGEDVWLHPPGTNIEGTGSQSGPFEPINWGDTSINEGAGPVRLTWADPIQTVVIRDIAGSAATLRTSTLSSTHISLCNISFSACVDPARLGEARMLPTISAKVDSAVTVDARGANRDT